MPELSNEDIAKRIVDAILEMPIFDKKSIYEIILSNIKIWTRKQSYKRTKNPSIDSLRVSFYKEKEEHLYWRQLVKTLLTEEEMQKHYSIIENRLEEMGLTK